MSIGSSPGNLWNYLAYLIGNEGSDVLFGLELGQGDDLGSDLQPHGHDGVHGVDVEERQHGHCRLLLI